MNRRAFLVTAAGTTTVGVAGCLDVFGDSHGATDDVVLDAPDNYDELRASRDEGYLSHPIHADELPQVTVPDALSGESVDTHQFVEDRHVLLTFIFTRCHGPCQVLTAHLGQVQDEAIREGYDDELAYLPTTFDPEYDTAEQLAAFGEQRADIDGDNWYMLRPESEARARTVVEGEFGVFYEWVEDADHDNDENGQGENGNDGDGDGENGQGENGNDGGGDHGGFSHLSMIILANADGFVERAYSGGVSNSAVLVDDVETLRERW